MRLWLLLLLAPPALAARLTVGPYLQDVRKDGFVVAFETDVETHAAVEVGAQRVATHGPRHEALVTGLHPSTRYPYRVIVDDVSAGEWEARTAPEDARPFVFIVYGDNRNGGEVEAKLTRTMAAENPDLPL